MCTCAAILAPFTFSHDTQAKNNRPVVYLTICLKKLAHISAKSGRKFFFLRVCVFLKCDEILDRMLRFVFRAGGREKRRVGMQNAYIEGPWGCGDFGAP